MAGWMDLFKGVRANREHSDLVCLDFGAAGMKAVRMKRTKDQVAVSAVELLPATPLATGDGEGRAARLVLPPSLRAKYAATTIDTPRTVVRLLNLPAHSEPGETLETQIRAQLGLGEDHRIGHLPISTPAGKAMTRVLATAVPEEEVLAVLSLLGAGAPAPCSLELAGLGTLTAFLCGPGAQLGGEHVCLVETGAHATCLSFLNRGNLALFRKYETGAESVVDALRKQFDVDAATATTILDGSSIDLTALLHEVMEHVFRQMTLSRDFVEREENCRVTRVFVAGGLGLSAFWRQSLRDLLGLTVETWNPFEGLAVAPGAIPAALAGQEIRFAAAVGAGLGVFRLS